MQMDPTTLQLIQVLERTVSSGKCWAIVTPACRDRRHECRPARSVFSHRASSKYFWILERNLLTRDNDSGARRERKSISPRFTCATLFVFWNCCWTQLPSLEFLALPRFSKGVLVVVASRTTLRVISHTITRDIALRRAVARRFVRRRKSIVPRDGCSHLHLVFHDTHCKALRALV